MSLSWDILCMTELKADGLLRFTNSIFLALPQQ